MNAHRFIVRASRSANGAPDFIARVRSPGLANRLQLQLVGEGFALVSKTGIRERATMRPPAMSTAHAVDLFASFDAIHAAGLRVAHAVEDSSKRETARPPRKAVR